MARDISITDTGGLVVANGDFIIVSPEETDRQQVGIRLKTTNPDHYYEQQLGSDLVDLFGQPNTETTRLSGEGKIARCLTYDGRFSYGGVNIRSAPTGYNTVHFFVLLDVARSMATLSPIIAGLQLNSGVLI